MTYLDCGLLFDYLRNKKSLKLIYKLLTLKYDKRDNYVIGVRAKCCTRVSYATCVTSSQSDTQHAPTGAFHLNSFASQPSSTLQPLIYCASDSPKLCPVVWTACELQSFIIQFHQQNTETVNDNRCYSQSGTPAVVSAVLKYE
jgi:hypothetical protein